MAYYSIDKKSSPTALRDGDGKGPGASPGADEVQLEEITDDITATQAHNHSNEIPANNWAGKPSVSNGFVTTLTAGTPHMGPALIRLGTGWGSRRELSFQSNRHQAIHSFSR